MTRFKKARIVRSESTRGDYIEFSVWDVQKNDLARKRTYLPSEYKTKEEKDAFLKDRVKQINSLLSSGYHIDRHKQNTDSQKLDQKPRQETKKESPSVITSMEVRKAIDKQVALRKAKKHFASGISFFKNTMLQFVDWYEIEKTVEGKKERKKILSISDITFHLVQDYQLYLLTDKENSNKTHNNALGVIGAFYNECIKQEWITGDNPLEKFEQLPTDYGTKNKPYTNEEVEDIKKYTLEHDPYLWVIISFIYYSFMRPVELRRLRINDIDLKENTIRIAVSQSKVKKWDVIPIHPELRKIIDSMNLTDYPKNYYLFASYKKPAAQPMGVNYMTKHFLKVKQHFGFDLDPDYTLYGFKHTACVNWYKAEKDIRKIQKMCRHATMSTTEIYLKSMGVLEDENAIIMLPAI